MNQDAPGQLTQKQKDNRRYYAKHAERIKAQKREAYARQKPVKPVRIAKAKNPPAKSSAASAKPKKAIRSKIEDLELAMELGINLSDLNATI